MLKYLPFALLAVLATGQAKAQIIIFQVSGIVQNAQIGVDDDTSSVVDPSYLISVGDSFTLTETLHLSVQGEGSDDGFIFTDPEGTVVITVGNLEYDMTLAQVQTDGTGPDASLVLSTVGLAPNGDNLQSGAFFSVTGPLSSSSTLDSLRALIPILSTASAHIQVGSANGYGSSFIGANITSYSITPSFERFEEESVPEPSTGALLALGALALGYGFRINKAIAI